MNLSAICFDGLSGRSAQKCKARSNMTKLVYKQKDAIAVTGAQTVDCYPTEYQGNDARRKSFDNRRRVLHSLI